MPKYKLYPKDFQPIPTPEEEAREDAMLKQNAVGARAFAAMVIAAIAVIWRDEWIELGKAIWSLFA